MDLKSFSTQKYTVIEDIPRFVESENFASPFGLQWNTFKKAQLDSYTKTSMSEDRVRTALQMPLESIKGLKIISLKNILNIGDLKLNWEKEVFLIF